ncbi:MAG: 4Fe-4S dicluster domain-containing protein [Deltaproteobacteria bacterium]|nr:4Fe-4S dicluster domain-containing protein [Deltaproteobacteria bacterium]
MKEKSFWGLTAQKIFYPPALAIASDIKQIPSPKRATFLVKGSLDKQEISLPKVGDTVKTGQKLTLSVQADGYAISSITGTVSAIEPYSGDFGKSFVAVTVDAADSESMDDAFSKTIEAPTPETAVAYLNALPGNPSFEPYTQANHGIHTIVVTGVDADMLVDTNNIVAAGQAEAIKKGVAILKQITGIEQVLVVVPRDQIQGLGSLGAELRAVDAQYPSALPKLIMKDVLDIIVPADKTVLDTGVGFFSAESIAMLGRAFETGQTPVIKTITVIRKDGSRILTTAKLGTPIREIISACGESLKEKDRLILGGPMTGSAIYSDEYPVCPDTDAVMIQDASDVSLVSDYPCINCGECVRACPVNIPVNLLVRFLEAGVYEEAADMYDLNACIDCGLCSYVCVAKIPIFQYIRLGKYELNRALSAEAPND